jgi:hypothetical protein
MTGLGLQFDRAEYEQAPPGAVCAACRRELKDVYYQAGASVVCEECRGKLQAIQTGNSDPAARVGRFLRASVFGFGAALAGCGLYYLVLAVTNLHVGLIAIAVGIMVGRAVHAGSQGRGGWLYQGLAMFLTYTAIVFSYVPMFLKEAGEQAEVPFLVVVIVMIPLLYVAPFFGGAGSILTLAIIGFGVYEAWKLNRKVALTISGPFSLTVPAPPPPDPIRP